MACIEKYNEQKNITNKIIVAKENLYNGTRQSDYEVAI